MPYFVQNVLTKLIIGKIVPFFFSLICLSPFILIFAFTGKKQYDKEYKIW